MDKKNRTRAGFIATLFLALGIGGYQAKESQEYVKEQVQTAAEYVKTTRDLNYLEQLKEQFLSYTIAQEHKDLRNLYLALTRYNPEKMNLEQFKGFQEVSFATLRELERVKLQHYEKGTPSYNRVQSRIIPEVKSYITTSLSLLEKRFPQSKEISKMNSTLK